MFFMNRSEWFDIIESDIYTNTSLTDDISFLSDSKNIVTDEKIINLVIKYFFAYRYNESRNEKIDLKEINELFKIGHLFFWLSRKKWSWVSSEDTEFIQNLNYFQKNWYALSMLWDISSTTIIIKDIINRTIYKDFFEWKYRWIDLWTWSAILLLAQYIQANRNNFNSIENVWFDISSSLEESEQIVQKLWIGEIIHWNTTKKETFSRFLKWGNITHISNETIPTSIVHMHTISDPFCENNSTIFNVLDKKIVEQTQFFPTKIEMIVKLWDNFSRDFNWSNSNKFSTKFIEDFWNAVKETMWDDLWKDWNILQNIYPKWIDISWKMTPMREIWKELIKKWSVKIMEDWRDRWK